MRSSFLAFCIFLTLDPTTFVSATTLGYDCDNEFFPNNELEEIAQQVMTVPRLEDPSLITLKRLSNWYSGPPFTKPYLLWPIPRKTEHYKGVTYTPYRVALDQNFEVFSVIITDGKNVRECKMRETFSYQRNYLDYKCGEKLFKNEELSRVARAACPQMRDGSMRGFPARYDGPYEGYPFSAHGRQLYIFPLLEPGVYKHGNSMEVTPSSFGW